MTFEERSAGDVTILDVRGRMTIEDTGEMALVNRVRSLVQGGCQHILLNLQGVPSVDTMGLCNIIQAYITTRRQGGSLKLVHLERHVREVLRVTKLLTVFETFESEADAIASFRRPTPTA